MDSFRKEQQHLTYFISEECSDAVTLTTMSFRNTPGVKDWGTPNRGRSRLNRRFGRRPSITAGVLRP